MKIRRPKLIVTALILAIFFAPKPGFGQNEKDDKRIKKMDSFRGYLVTTIDSSLCHLLKDSTTVVTDIKHYAGRNKKKVFGKITVSLFVEDREVRRTFYLDEGSGFFAITDTILQPDQQKLTYYCENGHIIRIVDQKGQDKTSSINLEQLERSIKLMFIKLIQAQFPW